MGLLSKLFGQKPNLAEVMKSEVLDFMKIANIPNTPANVLKTTVYVTFAQIAALNHMIGPRAKPVIDKVFAAAKDSTNNLTMKVGDLALDQNELKRILGDFPEGSGVSKDTTINGLAAFQAVYFPYAEEVIGDMGKLTEGPLGIHGSAYMFVADALKGPGSSKDNFMFASMKLLDMTKALVEASK